MITLSDSFGLANLIRLRQLIIGIIATAILFLLSSSPVHSREEVTQTPKVESDETATAVDTDLKEKDPILVEYPIAVLPFRERGKEVAELGGQTTDLVFASLAVDPSLSLVDRVDLDKTLGETELNLSGVVNPGEAIAIGRLTGARIIVTGSVFQVENTLYLIAKIIGTETSRVIGASVKGPAKDGLQGLADKLGDEIARSIKERSSTLVAKPISNENRIKALRKVIGEAERPVLHVLVQERHLGREILDPAAETEMIRYCKETGFTVIDHEEGSRLQAKYFIKGEGISEFAIRRGNLISVKARLEVKVVDRSSGKVVAVDRQTRVAVDLVEQLAGKRALQDAAADIAQRLLPKLVERKGKE